MMFSKRLLVLATILVVGLIGLWTVQSVTSLWGWVGGYGPREISVSAEGKATIGADERKCGRHRAQQRRIG